MRALLTGFVLFSAIGLSGCVGDDKKSAESHCESVMPVGFPTTAEGVTVGDTVPDRQMIDRNGNPVCTRDFAGKAMLLNSGAGWCPPCQDEAPGIQAVYEEFKSEGFVVVMAMLDDYTNNGTITNEDFFDEWASEYGLTFTLVNDAGGEFYTQYVDPTDPDYGGIPANIIVNRDQVVTFTGIGSMTESALRTRVNAAVGQPAVLEY